jgi:hypothetical protein
MEHLPYDLLAQAFARRLIPAAGFRIAHIRTMIDDEPSLRASKDPRHALTVALVKPDRGSC